MSQLDSTFERLVVRNMTDKAQLIAQSLIGASQTPGFGVNDAVEGLYDLGVVKRNFDTDEANELYTSARSGEDPDRNKRALHMAAKAQSDIVSLLERDYKQAIMSPIRSRCLEASRRAKQSESYGGVQVSVVEPVKSLLRAASKARTT